MRSILESAQSIPQGNRSVNLSNSGTPAEKASDIRAIYNGKGEGNSGVFNSRGMTTDEYMAMDFSKNKTLQKNGRPYIELFFKRKTLDSVRAKTYNNPK